jgi:hypothetical protein
LHRAPGRCRHQRAAPANGTDGGSRAARDRLAMPGSAAGGFPLSAPRRRLHGGAILA